MVLINPIKQSFLQESACPTLVPSVNLCPTRKGALAQLVEHLHGMQGVSGSNPLRSTTQAWSHMLSDSIPRQKDRARVGKVSQQKGCGHKMCKKKMAEQPTT